MLAAALTGCGGSDPGSAPTSSASTPPVTAPAPATDVSVSVPPRGACHQMTWEQALAPTDESPTADCGADHTAETFSVGQLKTTVDGHLLAVDSSRVQRQVARICPQRLAQFAGGSRSDLRLSMLRAIWFTPTVTESDQGANWLRCDAIVVAREGELAPVDASLRGALARPATREAYAMCATAEPGADDFERVRCSLPHRWRAVGVVDLGGGGYPGSRRVRAAGQGPCEDAGRERADDALDFRWGYEWPTFEQWTAGQTYGRCWAPDS